MTSPCSHETNVFKFRWKVTPRGKKKKRLISCGMKPQGQSEWGTSLEGAGLVYIKNANNVVGKNDFSSFITPPFPFAIPLSKLPVNGCFESLCVWPLQPLLLVCFLLLDTFHAACFRRNVNPKCKECKSGTGNPLGGGKKKNKQQIFFPIYLRKYARLCSGGNPTTGLSLHNVSVNLVIILGKLWLYRIGGSNFAAGLYSSSQ